MSWTGDLDRIYTSFDLGFASVTGGAANIEPGNFSQRRAQLRSRFRDLDKARTHLECANVWLTSASKSLAGIQSMFREVSARGFAAEVKQLGGQAAGELEKLGLSIQAALDARAQHQTTSVKLMRVPLLPFENQRERSRIIDDRKLAQFEFSVVIDLTVATRDWLLQPGAGREEEIRQQLLEALAPLRLRLWDLFSRTEAALKSTGASARKQQIEPIAKSIQEARRDLKRTSVQTIRRWYKRSFREKKFQDSYPLTASVGWHRGSVALLPEVDKALQSFVYQAGTYAELAGNVEDDIARRLAALQSKLTRETRRFQEAVDATSAVVSAELNDSSTRGMLRSLAGSFSSNLAASFSNIRETLSELSTASRALQSTLKKGDRLADDLPGFLYQCTLRMRDMPELARSSECGEKTIEAVTALDGLRLPVKRRGDAISDGYGMFIALVKDALEWISKNEGSTADKVDRRSLEKLLEQLAEFDTSMWLKHHKLIRADADKWASAADKLAEPLA